MPSSDEQSPHQRENGCFTFVNIYQHFHGNLDLCTELLRTKDVSKVEFASPMNEIFLGGYCADYD